MVSGPTDALARIALMISNAKWVAVYVGFALLLGAVMAWQQDRQQQRLKRQNSAG